MSARFSIHSDPNYAIKKEQVKIQKRDMRLREQEASPGMTFLKAGINTAAKTFGQIAVEATRQHFLGGKERDEVQKVASVDVPIYGQKMATQRTKLTNRSNEERTRKLQDETTIRKGIGEIGKTERVSMKNIKDKNEAMFKRMHDTIKQMAIDNPIRTEKQNNESKEKLLAMSANLIGEEAQETGRALINSGMTLTVPTDQGNKVGTKHRTTSTSFQPPGTPRPLTSAKTLQLWQDKAARLSAMAMNKEAEASAAIKGMNIPGLTSMSQVEAASKEELSAISKNKNVTKLLREYNGIKHRLGGTLMAFNKNDDGASLPVLDENTGLVAIGKGHFAFNQLSPLALERLEQETNKFKQKLGPPEVQRNSYVVKHTQGIGSDFLKNNDSHDANLTGIENVKNLVTSIPYTVGQEKTERYKATERLKVTEENDINRAYKHLLNATLPGAKGSKNDVLRQTMADIARVSSPGIDKEAFKAYDPSPSAPALGFVREGDKSKEFFDEARFNPVSFPGTVDKVGLYELLSDKGYITDDKKMALWIKNWKNNVSGGIRYLNNISDVE
tara:strand:- start:4687 stop:6360 length:1674 start_codon:yes stop_codon:yes gene_type:complete